MRKIHLFIFLIILLSACAKKSNVNPEDANSVTINGTVYPTVAIGNQVWTTVNYSGAGGYHSATENQFGDFYTRSQALAIILPAGWRVPAIADYETLISNYSPTKDNDGLAYASNNAAAKLAATTGWPGQIEGSDESGFNAEPAGFYQMTSSQTSYYPTDALFVTADSIAASGGKSGRWGCLANAFNTSINQAWPAPIVVFGSLRFVRKK